MKTTTSGIVESGEIPGSDVTTIETTTTCTFNRRKGSNQNPECTVTRVRVLKNPAGKPDTEPSETKESPTPADGDNQTGSAGAKNDQMCRLPSKEMTSDEAEAEMVDCMIKSHEKEKEEKDTVAGRTARNPSRPRWKFMKRKRDTS
jgi:hypothetical protein